MHEKEESARNCSPTWQTHVAKRRNIKKNLRGPTNEKYHKGGFVLRGKRPQRPPHILKDCGVWM